jgi:DNA-binding ferritin-like protein
LLSAGWRGMMKKPDIMKMLRDNVDDIEEVLDEYDRHIESGKKRSDEDEAKTYRPKSSGGQA